MRKQKKKPRQNENGKSNKVSIELRVDAIMDLLLMEFTRPQIVQYVSTNEKTRSWKLDVRQIDNYIRKAKEKIQSVTEPLKEKRVNTKIKKFNFLYKMALKNKDIKCCLAILAEENKLLGDYAATTSNLKVSDPDGKPLFAPMRVMIPDYVEDVEAEKLVNDYLEKQKGDEK